MADLVLPQGSTALRTTRRWRKLPVPLPALYHKAVLPTPPPPRPKPPRKYDLILYGASGFTGRQTVAYCQQHAPAGLRWAIAGRNRAKLETLDAKVDILIASSDDSPALDRLAASTRVVATTAGPFSLYGSGLVAACVRNATDYCDITGETPWIRGLIDRHHLEAERQGIRVIPCCGFDSIPSDYGAWLLARHIRDYLNSDCVRISAFFRMAGGVNGGTLATAFQMAESGETSLTHDPFLLDPEPAARSAADRARNADPKGAGLNPDIRAWATPFIMGPINTRIVRRTQALMNLNRFDYQEFMRFDSAFSARMMSVGTSAAERIIGSGLGRRLLRPLLAAPGAGPSEKTMDEGFFECEFIGYSADGQRARAVMKAKGDPGNRVTVKCLCESAFVLAANEPNRAGVVTPVAGMGHSLMIALQAVGFEFNVYQN